MTKVFLEERIEERLGEERVMVDRLSIEGRHWDGVYRVCVTKETIGDGFVTTIPFANGNFNIRLANGRKSQKKLDKLANYLEENKEVLADMWKAGKYQAMVNEISTDVIVKKIL